MLKAFTKQSCCEIRSSSVRFVNSDVRHFRVMPRSIPETLFTRLAVEERVTGTDRERSPLSESAFAVWSAAVLLFVGTLLLVDQAALDGALCLSGRASIIDVDGSPVEAISVKIFDEGNDRWRYSLDGGTSWNNFSGAAGTSVDISSTARLLNPTHRIRFVPDANYFGPATFTFRVWDQSSVCGGGTASTPLTTSP